jgi:hypothetical protein
MGPFFLISKYFWAVAIVTTFINITIWKRRSRKYIAEKPELAKGYEELFSGATVWLNIPWVVMGIGLTFGNVPLQLLKFNPCETVSDALPCRWHIGPSGDVHNGYTSS